MNSKKNTILESISQSHKPYMKNNSSRKLSSRKRNRKMRNMAVSNDESTSSESDVDDYAYNFDEDDDDDQDVGDGNGEHVVADSNGNVENFQKSNKNDKRIDAKLNVVKYKKLVRKKKSKNKEHNNNNNNNIQATTQIALPGGRANINDNYEQRSKLKQFDNFQLPISSKKPSSIGQIPDEISYHLRHYLDILFSSVILESRKLILNQEKNSIFAIPAVVNNILTYNNISFKTVKYMITKIFLPEPVWYYFDVQANELILFLYEPLYNNLCMKSNILPVTLSSGNLVLEKFNNNYYDDDADNDADDAENGDFFRNRQSDIDRAILNCAIVADHVAQHIISDIFDPNKKFKSSNLHSNYNKVGTTLHSMLNITAIKQNEHINEDKHSLTIIDNATSSAFRAPNFNNCISSKVYDL